MSFFVIFYQQKEVLFILRHREYNKQTDKISSIRVFDSTTEDEESISRYDFNQDEMGIYFPD